MLRQATLMQAYLAQIDQHAHVRLSIMACSVCATDLQWTDEWTDRINNNGGFLDPAGDLAGR